MTKAKLDDELVIWQQCDQRREKGENRFRETRQD